MPELPEVETTIKGLSVILNQKISNVKIHTSKLRFKIPNNIINILRNSKISNLRRIGKFIIIDLDTDYSLVIHLGMSGRLKTVDKDYKRIKHDHFILYFLSKRIVVYHDPRKFGFIDIVQTQYLLKQKYIFSLGQDALSPDLTAQMIFKKISKSEVPIKQILLNQKLIAGIGNIYASEILFDSKISPLTLGKDLEISLIMKLIKSTRKILKKAIKYGGSSIRDYRSTDGTLGNFQSNFKVYNKEGKKIGGDEVKKIIQYGRSTFYCPKLQNNK
ncbi:bifunctional DNA-formamidopyrimidine glycosylase/DNA-(apurinic or apyrimidinic site) lyase [Pelagibacteraceae bacterium]|nr:bifunctional DNA-formamidopyrimidine glycosylase/DNA-(apurinic or apyrimidinic site) lyase [Pelagibacteraceae bacterium]